MKKINLLQQPLTNTSRSFSAGELSSHSAPDCRAARGCCDTEAGLNTIILLSLKIASNWELMNINNFGMPKEGI